MATGGTSPGHSGGSRHHGGGKKKGKGNALRHFLRHPPTVNELTHIPGDVNQPKFLTFDPSIEAERRAAARGLLDTRQDTRRQLRQGRQDYRTSRRDIRVQKRRGIKDIRTGRRQGMQDFATQLTRGLEDIAFKRQDTIRSAQRGQQDFAIQLHNLVRNFNTLGGQQAQAANASGLYGDGTAQAAAQQRSKNLAVARQPIDVGMQRLQQDETTQLSRLGTETGRLEEDVGRGAHRLLSSSRLQARRLRGDTRHDLRLNRQDFHRNRQQLRTSLERAIREQRIGNIDLLQQELMEQKTESRALLGDTLAAQVHRGLRDRLLELAAGDGQGWLWTLPRSWAVEPSGPRLLRSGEGTDSRRVDH
jgi:hypothetical protein